MASVRLRLLSIPAMSFFIVPWGLALGVLGAGGAVPGAAALDKEAEAWLRQVHLLIVPDEERIFRQLRDKEDRVEFQKIFWARRDPDPATPRNEFQESMIRAQARADELFTTSGRKGSQSGCGQVQALLGEPDEVRSTTIEAGSRVTGNPRGAGTVSGGRDVRGQYDSMRELQEGSRRPEVWVYKSRTSWTIPLPGGEAQIEMDDACRFAEGTRLMAELARVAETRITRPDLGYRIGPSGRLVRLEELLHRESPGRALLRAPRTDFPIAVEPKLQLRSQSGGGYAAGLVRGEAAGLSVEEGPAGRSVSLVVVAQASDEAGTPALVSEREVVVPVAADGSFLVSFGLALKPGRYTLAVGCIDPKGERGSAVSLPFEMLDFGSPDLSVSPLLAFPAVEGPKAPTGQGPFAAFALGSMRLQPRFGNVFSKADAIELVAVLYNAALDPATDKAALRASFSLLKDSRPVARGQDQTFDTPTAVASVGPIPLASFEAGRYLARVTVTDEIAKRSAVRETAFEIRN
jgi:GWxTD domain-containing protein